MLIFIFYGHNALLLILAASRFNFMDLLVIFNFSVPDMPTDSFVPFLVESA